MLRALGGPEAHARTLADPRWARARYGQAMTAMQKCRMYFPLQVPIKSDVLVRTPDGRDAAEKSNKMKLVKKEGRKDDQPPGYPCRVRLFRLPFPFLPSRMTVVDVSDFGDLQANVCGDQPTNSIDGNIISWRLHPTPWKITKTPKKKRKRENKTN